MPTAKAANKHDKHRRVSSFGVSNMREGLKLWGLILTEMTTLTIACCVRALNVDYSLK